MCTWLFGSPFAAATMALSSPSAPAGRSVALGWNRMRLDVAVSFGDAGGGGAGRAAATGFVSGADAGAAPDAALLPAEGSGPAGVTGFLAAVKPPAARGSKLVSRYKGSRAGGGPSDRSAGGMSGLADTTSDSPGRPGLGGGSPRRAAGFPLPGFGGSATGASVSATRTSGNDGCSAGARFNTPDTRMTLPSGTGLSGRCSLGICGATAGVRGFGAGGGSAGVGDGDGAGTATLTGVGLCAGALSGGGAVAAAATPIPGVGRVAPAGGAAGAAGAGWVVGAAAAAAPSAGGAADAEAA